MTRMPLHVSRCRQPCSQLSRHCRFNKDASRACTAFAAKLKWRWHFRGEVDSDPLIRRIKGRQKLPTGYCGQPPAPELVTWLSLLIREVTGACESSVLAAKNRAKPFTNTTRLALLGLRTLRSSGYVAVPSDKDAGFVLVRSQDYVNLQHDILRKPSYTQGSSHWRRLEASRGLLHQDRG